jgi:hypothetical protein
MAQSIYTCFFFVKLNSIDQKNMLPSWSFGSPLVVVFYQQYKGHRRTTQTLDVCRTGKPRVQATPKVALHCGILSLEHCRLLHSSNTQRTESNGCAVLCRQTVDRTEPWHGGLNHIPSANTNKPFAGAEKHHDMPPSVFPLRIQLEGPPLLLALAANHWLFVYLSSWSGSIGGAMSGTEKSCSHNHKILVTVYEIALTRPCFMSPPRFKRGG